MDKLTVAIKFGTSLDEDDFKRTSTTLSNDCRYVIGEEVLTGPDAICHSYESNMKEGRKKLDKLEWGKCRIEPLGNNKFFVHFTDYLGHKGKEYTHRCKQKLTINDDNLINEIVHINDIEEQARLDDWYRSVDLK